MIHDMQAEDIVGDYQETELQLYQSIRRKVFYTDRV